MVRALFGIRSFGRALMGNHRSSSDSASLTFGVPRGFFAWNRIATLCVRSPLGKRMVSCFGSEAMPKTCGLVILRPVSSNTSRTAVRAMLSPIS
jgi:hypothetical protein